ncbi:hypothetical protein OG243_05140 [Streptomyces sp. NBC_01318]|uniref:hypothetical protein n=1 Tax=Streptomyces sp. NBC_01318 TaxID=2903823 RepID=UPI002E13CB9E|nr:hypothetical protein OG243_05140 [Streptomyces sp. NBC_01318]
MNRHAITMPLVPSSVRIARISTAEALVSFGVAPGSSLADAVLLVVSELVATRCGTRPSSRRTQR